MNKTTGIVLGALVALASTQVASAVKVGDVIDVNRQRAGVPFGDGGCHGWSGNCIGSSGGYDCYGVSPKCVGFNSDDTGCLGVPLP